MAEGTFTIVERNDLGGRLPTGGNPLRFEWNSDARNSPFMPWEVTLTQRTVRTDYTGGDSVSEQVLGPNYEPFTLEGIWRDKFNPASTDPLINLVPARERGVLQGGYAQETLESFTDLVRRGNPVSVEYAGRRGSLKFVGLITEFTYEYRTPWKIAYSFTVSPHTRGGDKEFSMPVGSRQAEDPTTLAQRVAENANAVVDALNSAKVATISGSVFEDTLDAVDDLVTAVETLSTTVDQRVITEAGDVGVALGRAVSTCDRILSTADRVSDLASDRKSADTLSYSTALNVLDFETWNRGMSWESRQTIFQANETRNALDRLEDPDAIALYRPYRGESLYSISNRFYGTPFNWRAIRDANSLPSSALKGTELLIIPSVGG